MSTDYRYSMGDLHNDMTRAVTARKCDPWCGLPYADESVPEEMDGPNGLPWINHGLASQPAYCTAACLERAKAASKPVEPEKPRREPVGGWRRLTEDVAFCGFVFECPAMECGRARYVRPTSASTSEFCCEACAERAGVFGPADAKTNGGNDANEDSEAGVSSTSERSLGEPAGSGMAEGSRRQAEPQQVTCSGPLATHGVAVLRVVGKPRWWDSDGASNRKLLCEGCYLHFEREAAEATNDDASWLADGVQPEQADEPPARIGTVPQVFGLNVGIWASRGMR